MLTCSLPSCHRVFSPPLSVSSGMQERGLSRLLTAKGVSGWMKEDILFLKHACSILSQFVVHERAKQVLLAQPAQSITCSIMEKPRTGLDECLRMLQACLRKRMSAADVSPSASAFLYFLPVERIARRTLKPITYYCNAFPNPSSHMSVVNRGDHSPHEARL